MHPSGAAFVFHDVGLGLYLKLYLSLRGSLYDCLYLLPSLSH